MNTMDDIYRLFLEREETFKDHTLNIFANMPFITKPIIEYLELPARDITWNSVDVIGQELIVMVTIPHNDRHQPSYMGEQHARILTIVLPVSVAETYDPDTILQYLIETFDVRKQDSMDDYDITGIVNYIPTVKKVIH